MTLRSDNQFQFGAQIAKHELDFSPSTIGTIQLNMTKLCNQACVHCHVDSSPRRREMMSEAVLEQVLNILDQDQAIQTVDLTGGAPELHPQFRSFVASLRERNRQVMVRHNLTVTLDPHPLTGESLEDLPEFFAAQNVELVSSLPYYQEYFTNKQRGDGVFQKSITSLRHLNQKGFGVPGSGRILNLVYNPVGAFLPADQASLEASYKRELWERYEISFNQLFALTNMPIHRFKAQLKRLKTYEEYMEKLVKAFNPLAAANVMCKNMVSISYDGKIYDCDFNQMLEIPILDDEQSPLNLNQWSKEQLLKRRIRVADHCFGCTAGAGSSCGGNTASD